MRALAATPLGWALLIAMVIGFGLLAVWQFCAIATAERWADRLKHVARGVVNAALAGSAALWLIGQGRVSADQTKDTTATLMAAPWGQALVVVIGLAVVAVGIGHVVIAARRSFLKDLTDDPGRLATVTGVVGFAAKGVALATVGALFVQAGLSHDPGRSTGLDGALRELLGLPLGPLLVLAIAVGFALYGVFALLRARYVRLPS